MCLFCFNVIWPHDVWKLVTLIDTECMQICLFHTLLHTLVQAASLTYIQLPRSMESCKLLKCHFGIEENFIENISVLA